MNLGFKKGRLQKGEDVFFQQLLPVTQINLLTNYTATSENRVF